MTRASRPLLLLAAGCAKETDTAATTDTAARPAAVAAPAVSADEARQAIEQANARFLDAMKRADTTTIAEIVHAVDEPLRATRCQAGKGCMIRGERCLTHDLWADLGDRIEDYLASVTLADVIGGRLRQDRHAA